MLTFDDITWFVHGKTKSETNVAGARFAFVIGNEVAEILTLDHSFIAVFNYADAVTEDEALTANLASGMVSLILWKNGKILERLEVPERFAAILLSSPKALEITQNYYRYWDKVTPGWLYINGQFIVPGHYE